MLWQGLPKGFCDIHLPKQDTAMVLEDENGKLYETKYLSDKTGLSAGWRGFSIAHKLLQGDVIVFHLVLPNKFMVTVPLTLVDFSWQLFYIFHKLGISRSKS